MAEFNLSDEDIDRIVRRLIQMLPPAVTQPVQPIVINPPVWPVAPTFPNWPHRGYEVWCGTTTANDTSTTLLINGQQ